MLFLHPVQGKIEDPAHKRRKTEWAAGLKKLNGDTAFAKDQFFLLLNLWVAGDFGIPCSFHRDGFIQRHRNYKACRAPMPSGIGSLQG